MSIDSPLIYKRYLRNEGEDAADEHMYRQIEGYRFLARVLAGLAIVFLIAAYASLKIWGSIQGQRFF